MGCAVGRGFTVVSDIHNHRVRNSVDVACLSRLRLLVLYMLQRYIIQIVYIYMLLAAVSLLLLELR